MSISEIHSQTEYKMKRTVETLREDFIKIRTGRASAGLLDPFRGNSGADPHRP